MSVTESIKDLPWRAGLLAAAVIHLLAAVPVAIFFHLHPVIDFHAAGIVLVAPIVLLDGPALLAAVSAGVLANALLSVFFGWDYVFESIAADIVGAVVFVPSLLLQWALLARLVQRIVSRIRARLKE
jgi:hypothetical protein